MKSETIGRRGNARTRRYVISSRSRGHSFTERSLRCTLIVGGRELYGCQRNFVFPWKSRDAAMPVKRSVTASPRRLLFHFLRRRISGVSSAVLPRTRRGAVASDYASSMGVLFRMTAVFRSACHTLNGIKYRGAWIEVDTQKLLRHMESVDPLSVPRRWRTRSVLGYRGRVKGAGEAISRHRDSTRALAFRSPADRVGMSN